MGDKDIVSMDRWLGTRIPMAMMAIPTQTLESKCTGILLQGQDHVVTAMMVGGENDHSA
jgi:hypothetical protein